MYARICVRLRIDINSSVEGTTIPATSPTGTAVSVNLLFMPMEVDALTFIVNDDSSKCAEQRTYKSIGRCKVRSMFSNK